MHLVRFSVASSGITALINRLHFSDLTSMKALSKSLPVFYIVDYIYCIYFSVCVNFSLHGGQK